MTDYIGVSLPVPTNTNRIANFPLCNNASDKSKLMPLLLLPPPSPPAKRKASETRRYCTKHNTQLNTIRHDTARHGPPASRGPPSWGRRTGCRG